MATRTINPARVGRCDNCGHSLTVRAWMFPDTSPAWYCTDCRIELEDEYDEAMIPVR